MNNLTIFTYLVFINIVHFSIKLSNTHKAINTSIRRMEMKKAIAFSVMAIFVSSSVFYSPILGFPTIQELKGHPVASLSNDVDCSSTEDGVKISSPNSCSEFYECDNGVAYLFQCANMTDGGRLYFDTKLQRCNWPSEVDCEITSTETPITTATEPSNDSTTKEYVQWLRLFVEIDDPNVDCTQVENGVKIPSPTSCSEFYECDNGAAYLFQCANMTDGGRLYYDPKLQRCNWPSEVDCEITSTDSPSTTTVNDSSDDATTKEYMQFLRMLVEADNSTVDCTQLENGEKIPSPTSCSEFYICDVGKSYLYKCPMMATGDRLYYDPELGVCNWPWMVDCVITTTESPITTTMVTKPSITTTIEPLSTIASQKNNTISQPTKNTTTASINTTSKIVTSEKPQTSTLPEDPSTTSKATSSQP